MLLEVNAVRSGQLVKDRSFAGLMDLYEQNYIRFRQIAPDLAIADQMISSVAGHNDLYLTIKERCKYTTMVSMTYRFEKDRHPIFEPDLHLKIYHDAKVVEVQHLLPRSQTLIYNDDYLISKWKANRFLYKWLGFCLYQGHKFQSMEYLRHSG